MSARIGIVIDGRVASAEHAMVSALDRGLLFGDGVAESFLARGDRAFAGELHFARLARSCSLAKLTAPDEAMLARSVRAATAVIGDAYAAVRIVVTRGAAGLTLDQVAESVAPTCIVLAREITDPTVPVAPIAVTRAESPFSGPRGVKALACMSAFVERAIARENGFDDAIWIDVRGHVIEGATSNVIAVSRGTVIAPIANALAGITRDVVLDHARNAGLGVEERALSFDELAGVDEMFLTSSLRGIAPVHRLDDRTWSAPGAITTMLRVLYVESVARALNAR